MLIHKKEGLVYQTAAPYMLAYYIGELFANDELALRFSEKAREHAMETHDREVNNNTLISIYKGILSDS